MTDIPSEESESAEAASTACTRPPGDKRRRRRRHALARARMRPDTSLGQLGSTATRVVAEAASILEEELASGINAAKAVERRFVDVDTVRGRDPEVVLQRFRRDAHDLVDIVIDLVDVAIMSTGSLGQRSVSLGVPSEGNGSVPQQDKGPRVPALVITDAVFPGSDARTTLAVENNSEDPTAEFTFSCSDLISAAGDRIPADVITFLPARIAVDAEDTAKVTVTVAVPVETAPGYYSGLLQAGGLEQVRAVLSLQVS